MQLLPDKPINKKTSKSIDFAYEELSKSIAELIGVSPKPFTIGLFGKWGTGKSTIIESLRDSLDKRSYVFIKFDIWKYESDALRRSFLLDMAGQLKGKTVFSKVNDKYIERLKNRLYTTTQYGEEKFKFSWRTLLMIILAIIVVVAIYWLLSKGQPLGAVITTVVGLMGLDILKTFLLDKSNFTQQISIGEDRVNSPEEFYGEFKTLVEMSKKTFVIVIDNLDRTQKEKTIELLSTVKTFLNADDTNDNVVFIIASDDKAIKEHIAATYSNNNEDSRFDANEFLKKFFNVTIDIPVFIESEIGSYTKKLLNQTGISEFKDNTDLQQIINYAYRENPREIKQYINNLAAYYILLSGGVPKNGLTADFITNNLNFICKLLIARDKFETVFAQIKIMVIDNSLTWSEIERKLRESKSDLNVNLRNYLAFSELTGWCVPSDEFASWFFRLRRSSEDQRLPGWDLFVNAALQQDYDNASKLFLDFTDMTALGNQMQAYINGSYNDAVRFTPFFSVYIRILLTLDEEILEQLKVSIDLSLLHTPNATELNKIGTTLDIKLITEKIAQSKYVRPASFAEFIKSISQWLSESTINAIPTIPDIDIAKLINAIYETTPKLDGLKAQLRKEIEHHHANEDILQLLAGKSQAFRDELVTNSALRAFFTQILPNEVNAIKEFDLIGHFNIKAILLDYLTKLSALVGEVNARSVEAEKVEVTRMTYASLSGFVEQLKAIQEPHIGEIVRMTEVFAGWYPEQPTDKDKSRLILLLALLAQVPGNTSGDNAKIRLSAFVQQANISEVIELLRNKEIDWSVEEVQQAIRERMATNPDDVVPLVSFINAPHVPYVTSHMSQKAVDTTDEDTYRKLLDLDHKLFPKVSDSEQAMVSNNIYIALSSGITKFPDVVKANWDKKFINADQRRELKHLMTEHEESLKNQDE
jgi:GTPase SAR1 family protein